MCYNMTHGVMELKVLTIIITLRHTERTHLLTVIGVTGNAIQYFLQRVVLATGIGSVIVN